jgi:predicted nucleic acid-binding protein
MTVALDSNILLRWFNRQDAQHLEVRAALRLLRNAGTRPCYFPHAAAEFWRVSTRPATARGGYGVSVKVASRRLDILNRLFVLHLGHPAQFGIWRQLVETHGVVGHNAHDARLVAAMIANGVFNLITYDIADFKRYTALFVFTPADVIARGGQI